jgi:nitrogen fixation NifU-like protein
MTDTAELQALYRQTVLDHCRHPRNCRRITPADRQAEGYNPLCGDKVTIYLTLAEDGVADAAFEATGCAISLASASMLTSIIRGKRFAEIEATIDDVDQMFTPGGAASAQTQASDLGALSGVSAYPSRIRCATLPWRTLVAALHADPKPVTTE